VLGQRACQPPRLEQRRIDLPSHLSASQLDVYRQCPYRFFARAVLRLDDPEDLDAALAKRDYGNWLHEVEDRIFKRSFSFPMAPRTRPSTPACRSLKVAQDC
jgi:ATP-dependent helicase/DNAse subunit B